MSWAKAGRILVVFPPNEKVELRPLDLRILQQHARELGAEMGLVARAGSVRRDAGAFGIPVFRSTTDAQRASWARRESGRNRRALTARARLAALRLLRERARPSGMNWAAKPAPRIMAFSSAVLAVLVIGTLFLPGATITLPTAVIPQEMTLMVDTQVAGNTTVLTGTLPLQNKTVSVSGSQTQPVSTLAEVPQEKAKGFVEFQNLTASPILIPAGTVVYSLEPELVRFVTIQEIEVAGGAISDAGVPVEALVKGSSGNLPAGAIVGTEGGLSASVTVTNPAATAGGSTTMASMPSDKDREQLRASLLEQLQTEARSDLQEALGPEDVLLDTTIRLKTVDQEAFDPQAGQPGSVLSLALSATFETDYVGGRDLRQLAELALDAQVPTGYAPRPDSLEIVVTEIPPPAGVEAAQLQLQMRRLLGRSIDLAAANQLARGRSPAAARRALQEGLPLGSAPEIRMRPSWWPWLPLIPFRIQLVLS